MCTDCKARRKLVRDAFMKAKFAEAAGHMAKGAAEFVGLKEKTGSNELQALPSDQKTEKRNPALPANRP